MVLFTYTFIKEVLHTISFLDRMKSYLQLSLAARFPEDLQVLAHSILSLPIPTFVMPKGWETLIFSHQYSVYKRSLLLLERAGQPQPWCLLLYLFCHETMTHKIWTFVKSELLDRTPSKLTSIFRPHHSELGVTSHHALRNYSHAFSSQFQF